jgi:hypothetical protein
MLCTFTTEGGDTLIIRSDDIRAIEDGAPNTSLLVCMLGDKIETRGIQGTARENRDRILQEEVDQVGTVELHRFKTQQLLQAQPQPRGKQAR